MRYAAELIFVFKIMLGISTLNESDFGLSPSENN